MCKPNNCHSSRISSGFFLILFSFIITGALSAQVYADVSVTLAWNESKDSNVKGYRVFCHREGEAYDYDDPAWEGDLASCTITREKSTSDHFLKENVSYFFVVRAVGTNGAESGNSNEIHYFTGGEELEGSSDANPPNSPRSVFPVYYTETGLSPILETSEFSDPDATDTQSHAQWRLFRTDDNVCVLNRFSTDDLTATTVPALILDCSSGYYWSTRHQNTAGAWSGWSEPAHFTTAQPENDVDGDGVPDDRVVTDQSDLDGSGIPDNEESHIKSMMTKTGDAQIGISVRYAANTTAINAVDTAWADARARVEPGTFPQEVIAFKVTTTHPGDHTEITVHLSVPPVTEGIWDYGQSSRGTDNADHAWFSQDQQTIDIQVRDGGYGDADGLENGTIVHLVSFGYRQTTIINSLSNGGSSGTGASGGNGCFVGALL
ncbi:MAG: fibronectin type III domain-containing protein [Desulfobacteraceae bacterium]|nr:fibronectin type III domain-containing protein [Desulfobacteraceae bacterium]